MLKKIKIKFSSKIYNKKAIESSIRDFKDTAVFEMIKKDEYFVVLISGIAKGLEAEIKDEFCNYVLYLIPSGDKFRF